MDYPILVAPLRRFDQFSPSEQGLIRDNRMVAFMYIPVDPPIENEFVVDLRLTQPIPAAELHGGPYVASLGAELAATLQAKIVEFTLRDRTLRCD